MSIEAYKIAVQIALTDKISSGLVVLSDHFARTNISAKDLKERVARINKLTLVGGMLMALQNFNKKVEDLELVIGQNGDLIDMATKALTWSGNAVQRVTASAEKHPELTKLAVEGFAVVSVMALVGGSLLDSDVTRLTNLANCAMLCHAFIQHPHIRATARASPSRHRRSHLGLA